MFGMPYVSETQKQSYKFTIVKATIVNANF